MALRPGAPAPAPGLPLPARRGDARHVLERRDLARHRGELRVDRRRLPAEARHLRPGLVFSRIDGERNARQITTRSIPNESRTRRKFKRSSRCFENHAICINFSFLMRESQSGLHLLLHRRDRVAASEGVVLLQELLEP